MTSFRLTLSGLFMAVLLLIVASSAQADPIPSYQTKTFTSSDTWTIPSNAALLDILVVGAGGGGGGESIVGGGGGGGEINVCNVVPVTAGQSLTVAVGNGGISASGGDTAASGNASSASYDSSSVCDANGGSGGNGGSSSPPVAGGASGGNGPNAGGSSGNASIGGGGGGAGAAGGNSSIGDLYIGGAGGSGITPSSLAAPGLFSDVTGTYYGGGGGGGYSSLFVPGTGGVGGQGGGGFGAGAGPAPGGTNSGGGGGGGGSESGTGGPGGSGYVEVRYISTSANSTPPQVSGVNAKGEQLSTDDGTWTNSPTSYTYNWQRCDDDQGTSCVTIGSETSSTYTASANDVGKYIRSQVTAINAGGPSQPQASVNYMGPIIDTFSLDITKSGNGTGTVIGQELTPTSIRAQNGYPINCGTNCDHVFFDGAVVTLTATANPDSTFVKWSGDYGACSDTNPVCEITMGQARTIDAQFDIGTELVAVTKSGTGSGTVASTSEVIATSLAEIDCGSTCESSFPFYTKVTLTATPDSNSTFTKWTGDCDSTDGNKCVVDILPPVGCNAAVCNANVISNNIDAEFTAKPTPPEGKQKLTVEKSDGGSVTSDPAGIDCGSTCDYSFDSGTKVTLTAKATSGYKFSGFSGACSGSSACVVEMSEAKTVKATFAKLAAPQLELQIDVGRNSLRAGQQLPVTINVENIGEETAANAVVCFTIPSGFSFVSATKPYTIKGRLVCWKLGDIAGGEVKAAGSKQVKVNLRALKSAKSRVVSLRAAAAAENASSGSEVTAKSKTKVKVKKAKRKPRPVTG